MQAWVTLHLQYIGEAARRVSPELQTAHPEIPWSEIIKLRTVLVHHYFDVDTRRLWGVVERDLPALRAHVNRLLEIGVELGPTPPSASGQREEPLKDSDEDM